MYRICVDMKAYVYILWALLVINNFEYGIYSKVIFKRKQYTITEPTTTTADPGTQFGNNSVHRGIFKVPQFNSVNTNSNSANTITVGGVTKKVSRIFWKVDADIETTQKSSRDHSRKG